MIWKDRYSRDKYGKTGMQEKDWYKGETDVKESDRCGRETGVQEKDISAVGRARPTLSWRPEREHGV